jgi:hypothetical protein
MGKMAIYDRIWPVATEKSIPIDLKNSWSEFETRLRGTARDDGDSDNECNYGSHFMSQRFGSPGRDIAAISCQVHSFVGIPSSSCFHHQGSETMFRERRTRHRSFQSCQVLWFLSELALAERWIGQARHQAPSSRTPSRTRSNGILLCPAEALVSARPGFRSARTHVMQTVARITIASDYFIFCISFYQRVNHSFWFFRLVSCRFAC